MHVQFDYFEASVTWHGVPRTVRHPELTSLLLRIIIWQPMDLSAITSAHNLLLLQL